MQIWWIFILPTADRDKHGFLWSRMSQICMNVSILQEAIMSGSLGCQFRSLITRVCAFRLCVVCNSYPPAPVKLNISTRELLWNRKRERRILFYCNKIIKLQIFYIYYFPNDTSYSANTLLLTDIAHNWLFRSHGFHSADPTSYLLCRWNFFSVFISSSKRFTAKYLRLQTIMTTN